MIGIHSFDSFLFDALFLFLHKKKKMENNLTEEMIRTLELENNLKPIEEDPSLEPIPKE